VRQRLDEVVTVRTKEGASCYQGGTPCPAAADDTGCPAVLLPDDLVLSKQIQVPLQAESEIGTILELEIRASSPFAAADTRWGWSVVARDEASIRVVLAIVSASAAMAFLAREYDSHDSQGQEVWARAAGVMVVVQGFGEGLREQRYRRRLLHSAALLGVIAGLLLALVAVAALFKGAELNRLEALSATVTRDAAEASRLRTLLAAANETIGAANEVVARYPNPHAEIARLTRLLGDDASIASFSMNGPEIRLRGQAADAALVMQQLTDEPGYLEVEAPQAIVRLGDTGKEQFYLDIRLGKEEPR
jgi:hypothetical protein